MSKEFKIGDVVRHRLSGKQFVVVDIDDGDKYSAYPQRFVGLNDGSSRSSLVRTDADVCLEVIGHISDPRWDAPNSVPLGGPDDPMRDAIKRGFKPNWVAPEKVQSTEDVKRAYGLKDSDMLFSGSSKSVPMVKEVQAILAIDPTMPRRFKSDGLWGVYFPISAKYATELTGEPIMVVADDEPAAGIITEWIDPKPEGVE